ncbi:MAG: ribosome maturation factor RimP [Spiribacter sp.]|jgi:ribosome maturation factor RimP|nr:ribosome maturation factor RimP [Spiribacter sp.]MDR9489575.1 ribosome maturation factor RimP [Spiribacter sp.]
MKAPERVTNLLEPVVEGLGYELVGVEYQSGRQQGLLRLYIDRPEGVEVDDCARVSHQVSGVLDVEDPIAGEYLLEVSSPGTDRPVFKTTDYDRFVGEQVRLRLHGRLEGRRKFRGRLLGLRGDNVVIEEQGEEVAVPITEIDRAHVELEP